jgi:hypothetical protein
MKPPNSVTLSKIAKLGQATSKFDPVDFVSEVDMVCSS